MKQASRDAQKAVPVPVLLGRRLRGQREARKLRQDEIAAVARRWGFDWTHATVAMLEAGRRRLVYEEQVVLPWIIAGLGPETAKRGEAPPLELADLFPSSIGEKVILNRRFLVDAASIGVILSGRARERGLALADVPPAVRAGASVIDQRAAGEAENVAVVNRLWPGLLGRVSLDPDSEYQRVRRLLEADAHTDKMGDAERKGAKRLRTFPLAVAAAARKRWGRSLTEERDRQLAEAIASGGSPQARRGHITRGLLDELRQEGIEGLRPERISKKRAEKNRASWQRAIARARSHP